MNDNTTEETFDERTEREWLEMHWSADYAAGLEKYREIVRQWLAGTDSLGR